MSARFLGALSRAAALTGEDGRAAWRTTRFRNGFLSHDSIVDFHESAGDLCIALGEPRFADASLAATASAHGAAAAWLAAYRSDGASAAARVAGRFSAIVIRPEHGAALLVTDRFATWPVCYAATAEQLSFADSATAVPCVSREISHQALFDYLYFHAIPAPSTAFTNVERLPAGHTLEWRSGGKTLTRYWKPRFIEDARPDFGQSKTRFRQLIRDAVAREAGSGNVGAFLSGGTDSSTVVGMLRDVTQRAPRTYSIGFEAQGYDEMEYARIAARQFGTDHHEYYVTPDDLIRGIPSVAAHYDQPFGNSSALPAWICASRAKADGVDSILAGDGGDELFGGNERYAVQRVLGCYDTLPRFVRNSMFESAVLALHGIPVLKKAASYVAQARVPMPDRLQTYNLLTRIGISNMLDPGFLSAIDADKPSRSQKAFWDDIDARSLTNRMLAFDWQYTLADNDLPKVTGTASLAGIDVAFPLLDDDLVEFSLSLPPAWKVRGLKLRWFFKEALRDFLPIEIIKKRKHGFGLPFGVWTNRHEGLQKLARDTLGSFENRGIVQPAFARRLLQDYLPTHPGYYGELVWIFAMLELWLRSHAPDWRAQT